MKGKALQVFRDEVKATRIDIFKKVFIYLFCIFISLYLLLL